MHIVISNGTMVTILLSTLSTKPIKAYGWRSRWAQLACELAIFSFNRFLLIFAFDRFKLEFFEYS